jgi:hypothetical protein
VCVGSLDAPRVTFDRAEATDDHDRGAGAECTGATRLPPALRGPGAVAADLGFVLACRTIALAVFLVPAGVVADRVATRSLGGAGDWALILTFFGLGLVAGSLTALRLQPRRRMLVGLALGALFAPLALLAGAQLTLLNTFWETTLQEQFPPALISRVTAIDWLSSVAVAPIGYALVGVLATHVLSIGTTLWLAAAIAAISSVAVTGFPSVRAVTRAR